MNVKQMTADEYLAADAENGGICTQCGEYTTGVEPDAEKYTCENCGKHSVYGIEQALLIGALEITCSRSLD